MKLYQPTPNVKIILKNDEEIALMRQAGRIVAQVHAAWKEVMRPGISTLELDKLAETIIRDHGAIPSFIGQDKPDTKPYEWATTASINEEVVHGIPRADRVLKEGDIVGLDTACNYNGFVADSGWTYAVGEVKPSVRRLMEATEKALEIGIEASVAGRELKDVSRAIQQHIEAHGYGIVREYTGHGVGKKMWEEPPVPNWWPGKNKGRSRFENVRLVPGMTYAIEPMVCTGTGDVKELDDGWTVVTTDRSLCAHYEHTIAITPSGPQILTLP